MGVREKLNQHPGVTAGGAIVLIVLALIFLGVMMSSRRPRPLTHAFFTVDDGKTWFKDSRNNIPPFDHDGKEAVYAAVLDCPHGGGKFVGYLSKYPPEVKQGMDDQVAHGKVPLGEDTWVKRPGVNDGGIDGKGWYDARSAKGHEITDQITCPDGSASGYQAVFPE